MNLCLEFQKAMRLCVAIGVVAGASPVFAGLSFSGGIGSSDTHESSTTKSTTKNKGDNFWYPKETKETKDSEAKEVSVGIKYSDEKTDGAKTEKTDVGGGFKWSRKNENGTSETTNGGDKYGGTRKEQDSRLGVDVKGGQETEYKVDTGDKFGDAKGTASWKHGWNGEFKADRDGVDGNIEYGAGGKLRGEYGKETRRYGTDDANIKIGGKVYTEAEIAAKIGAELKCKEGEFKGKLGGEIGASVSVGGEVTIKTEILGVPTNVKFEGKASYGAKAKANAGVEVTKGKVVFYADAGLVFGGGLEGKVTVEIGIDELLKLLKDGVIDKILHGDGDDDPFNSLPNGGHGGSSDKNEHYQGLKPIKLIR